jgi:hypothetical protein
MVGLPGHTGHREHSATPERPDGTPMQRLQQRFIRGGLGGNPGRHDTRQNKRERQYAA